jgi:hypothetical protein
MASRVNFDCWYLNPDCHQWMSSSAFPSLWARSGGVGDSISRELTCVAEAAFFQATLLEIMVHGGIVDFMET